MIRRRHHERPRPRIEVVPMIDIMMFLLVFFIMLVLRMIPDAGVSLTLPTATTTQQLPNTQVVIVIDKGGDIHVQDKVYSTDELTQYLDQQKANAKLDVIVAGDKGTTMQQLMTVMDVVRKDGITDLGIATKPD